MQWSRMRWDQWSLNSPSSAEGGGEAVDALARESREPLNRGVSAMFSPAGYDPGFLSVLSRIVDEQQEDFWVYRTDATGQNLDPGQLTNQVSQLYFEDYIETWWQFLNDVRIREFNNFREAAELLDVLSDRKNSPLLLFLHGAAQNTRLVPVDKPGDEEDDEGTFFDNMGNTVDEIFREGPDEMVSRADPAVVDRAFESLDDLFTPGEDGTSPISGIIKDLENLYIYLDRIAEQGAGAASAADRQDLSRAVASLKRRAKRADPPLGGWIEEIAGRSSGLVTTRARSDLNSRWRSEVASFCQQTIANRYPFSPDSLEEVRLQDFGKFFGPGGRIEQFFTNNLKSYVNTNTDPWKLKTGVQNVRVSGQTLQQIQIAQAIKDAFFSSGGNLPHTSFTMTPVNMDENTQTFMLKVDGQRINYDHGPTLPQKLKWPGSDATSQVQIQFSPDTSQGGSRSKTGEWAWFRLLDESEIRDDIGLGDLRITFRLADRWIVYDLSSSSTVNPFNLRQLRAFRCTSNL